MKWIKVVDKLPDPIARGAYSVGSKLAHYSPEILIGAGIAGGIITVVTACKATLKVDEVLAKSEEEIKKVKEAKETFDKETYSDEDYKKDLTIAYTHKARDLFKLYGPSVAIGTASIVCILSAHNILNRRNLLLVGAYNATNEILRDYRGRVAEHVGKEVENDIYHGLRTEKVEKEETDENGKTKKVKKTVTKSYPDVDWKYRVFFDETCEQWDDNHEYCMSFLQGIEEELNRLLVKRGPKGKVFFWELLEMIGVPTDNYGEFAYTDGWTADGTIHKIHIVNFDNPRKVVREFVNGWTDGILLEPNCDGNILGMA